MNSLSVISRLLRKSKIELIFIFLFSCILIFYCCNPYVINPAEFILYTKYLVPVGFFVWMFSSYRIHLLILESIPLEWLNLNEIVRKPIKIVFNQIVITSIYFLMLHIVIANILSSTIVVIFSSGFDLYKLILQLYLIYFAIPFFWAWIIGISISIIHRVASPNKSILLLSIFLAWILAIFFVDYRLQSFNIFIENRWPYIDPLLDLTFLKEKTSIKLIYLICTLGICFIFIKVRSLVFGITFSAILIIIVTFVTYNYQNQYRLEKILIANDQKLFDQFKGNSQVNTKMTDSWRITEVKVEPETKFPIQIEMTLDKKKKMVHFSINEQFSISSIESEGKKIPFKQQGGIVEVKTNGVKSMVLSYDSTIGTSFYPLLSNVIFLPFDSNWYPQSTVSHNYIVDHLGTFYPNADMKKCKKVELIVNKEKYHWQGNNLRCLTIIKGAYQQIKIPKTNLIVYKPFLTQKVNYINLRDKLLSIRNELCDLFNNSIDNNYCKKDIETIVITSKSMNSTSLSLNDSSISEGYYSFSVNPFLDVNYMPVTEYIEELATILIPYRLFEDKQLSLFASEYLIEKLNIIPTGYLESINNELSIEPKDWDSYNRLPMEKKKQLLIQMFQEKRSND